MAVSFDLVLKSMLLRYVSEWDPRRPASTKGGYVRGEIAGVPHNAARIILTTVPSEDCASVLEAELGDRLEDAGLLHPLLLHVVRMRPGRRDNELEPVPTHYNWKQEFVIDKEKYVRIVNRVSELDIDPSTGLVRDVPTDLSDDRTIVTQITESNSLVFGCSKEQINLIALQPKQQRRAQKEDATISSVLTDRLGSRDKDLAQLVEKHFSGKNKINLRMFRIKVDFYCETGLHLGSCISEAIKDTGSRACGAMDIHDVSVQKSCTAGGRKVFMVSEFGLADDVIPVFQVYDNDGRHCPEDDLRINQPDEWRLKRRKESIHFITPPQNNDVIYNFEILNKSLRLLFKRKSDNYESPTSFKFQYVHHPEDISSGGICFICDLKVDTAGDDDVVTLAEGLQQPKPRIPKRVIRQEFIGKTFRNFFFQFSSL